MTAPQITRTKQLSLTEQSEGLDFKTAVELALESLIIRTAGYDTFIAAYSGGKDSTALVNLLAWAIKTGRLYLLPRNIHIVYSDTLQELPPLHDHAMKMLDIFSREGFNVHVVEPALDETFFVRMLGRGLPVPGGDFRWCVSGLKIRPIEKLVKKLFHQSAGTEAIKQVIQQNQAYLDSLAATPTKQGQERQRLINSVCKKLLVITGVRLGESAVRDDRIFATCTKDGECGAGMWQPSTPEYDRLAPLLHMRTCHIFDFLKDWLPAYGYEAGHGYPTQRVSLIYGDQDIRTGCNACPIASRDVSLERAIAHIPECKALSPLLKLRLLWEVFRTKRHFRLHNDGSGPKKRATDLGPLTMEARRYGYDFLRRLQKEIYDLGGTYQILDLEQRERIIWHWANNSWPQGWTGEEPVGSVLQLVPKGQMSMLEWFGE